jgi:plastocyanin
VKRLWWVTPAALGLAVSGMFGPPSQAATVTVSVVDHSFVNGIRTVAQGTTVVWSFDSINPHTTTSNQRFWASPTKTSGSFSQVFRSAGRFGYFCQVHPHMTGLVTVPVRANRIPGGKRVRWASGPTAGRTYDIQVKRPGATTFTTFRTGTTALAKAFRPKKDGRYVFRARTRNLANGLTSGWSPGKVVRIG